MAIKFFNDVAVDSDVLYVDTASNRVGIGTANPSYALDVSGTIATDSGFLAAATLPSLSFIDTSGGGEIYTSAGSMYFKTGIGTPTNKMAILSGGNVGIGTTSPRGTLDINGPLSVIGGTWTSGASGADSNASAGIVLRRGKKLFSGIPSGGNEDFYLRSLLEQTSSNEIIIGQGGTALVSDISLKPGSNGNIKFFGSGSEDMRINSSGNVGIGLTSTNSVKLAITGNSGFPATSGTTQTGLLRLKASNNATLDMGADGTFSSGWLQVTDVADLSNNYDLLLQPNGGDVGIGVQFPNELLHIKGSTANTAMEIESSIGGSTILKFNNDGGGSGSSGGVSHIYFGTYNTFPIPDIPDRGRISYSHNTQTLGGDYMSFTTGSIERVRILSGGNFGINTTNPTEKLTVSGNAYITNNLYVGSGNTLKSCTYSATNGLMVGVNNSLGGVANGIIGVGNTIDCTAAPWDLFGGNFIAGKENTINNQYSHANAVFGQLNTLGNSADTSNNIANSLIAGSEHTLFSNNALVYGLSCFASNANHSLTGGYDSNNFSSYGSVAIGSGATASAGLGQYAFGTGITTPTTVSAAYGPDQFVVGKFNEYTNASSVPHRFAVGNGVSDASRATPFCVIGSGTYTNGQVSINDSDGFAYTSIPYSVFHVNGRATSSYSSTFTVTSDERLKDNILDYDKGLAEILQVKPKSYTFNGKANTIEGVESIGVLAQEIKDVFPETIGTVNKRLNPTDEEETELYTVDISPVTYALINAIKELNAKIEALENRIQILEGN